MREDLLQEVAGYIAQPRNGPCLDDSGEQVSGCAFTHGSVTCVSVACHRNERDDGRTVTFVRPTPLQRAVKVLEEVVAALGPGGPGVGHYAGLCSLLSERGVTDAPFLVTLAARTFLFCHRYPDGWESFAFPCEGIEEYSRRKDRGDLWTGAGAVQRLRLAQHVLSFIYFHPEEARRIVEG